jgi:NhaP-type Na+/H+ or K+/H+ antiporter
LRGGEYAAAAWFGPKGFASVVYGLVIPGSGIEQAALLFQLIAMAATVSMVLHPRPMC